DVMRQSATDAYGGLISALKQQGYVEGKDLRLLPYDWRMSPDAAMASLSALVDRTLAETGAAKVVLIGHSMGGLIARDYIVHGGSAKVKAMIGLATPWLGSPMAYKALAYGWDLGLKVPGTNWPAVPFDEIKLLVQNYASVYALAPDRAFFDLYGGFLIRGGKMLSFGDSLTQALAPHNRTLARQYDGWGDQLLDGSDHGVMQFLMAGRGMTTLGGYTERTDWLGMTEKTEWNVDGDGVVPRHSADLGNSRSPALAARYLGHLAGVAYANADHTLFTQSPAVQQAVVGWLAQVNR
ncbi:MAG: esterase/lipase family protein, partial [Mycobacterium leprae]